MWAIVCMHDNKNKGPIGQHSVGFLHDHKFYAAEKSDGIRLFCYISTNNIYLIDREFNMYQINHSFYNGNHGLGHNTVIDGELVTAQLNNMMIDVCTVHGYLRSQQHLFAPPASEYDKISEVVFKYYHCYTSKSQLLYLVFDTLAFNGLCVTDQNLSVRLKQIDKFMRLYHDKLAKYPGVEEGDEEEDKDTDTDTDKNKDKEQDKEMEVEPAVETNGGTKDTDNTKDDNDDNDNANGNDQTNGGDAFKKLSAIATKQNNDDQNVKAEKDFILKLIYSKSDDMHFSKDNDDDNDNASKHDDDSKGDTNDATPQAVDHNAKHLEFNSTLPLNFTKKTYYNAVQSELKQLFSCITEEAVKTYYYTDPQTGRRNRNDGVVFTPENNDYFMRREKDRVNPPEVTRKWKPRELQTIDVKINIYRKFTRDAVDRFIQNDDGFVHLLAFDADQRETVEFGKIDIGKSGTAADLTEFQQKQRKVLKQIYEQSHEHAASFNNHLRHVIVECCYNLENESWDIMHWREDKTSSNALKTCESVWKKIQHPITPNDLIQACPER